MWRSEGRFWMKAVIVFICCLVLMLLQPVGVSSLLSSWEAPAVAAERSLAATDDEGLILSPSDPPPLLQAGSVDGWTLVPTTTLSPFTPPARAYHAIAATPSGVLLFGGWDGNNLLGDTWLFNTATNSWALLTGSPSTPPARWTHAMAATPSGVLLFGGWDGGISLLGDTWLFNTATNTWGLLTDSPAPPARQHHAMAATPSGNVLLFGGWSSGGLLGDTWLFNTATNSWGLLTGSPSTPPPRFAHAMSATPAGDLLLFGGRDSSGSYLNDTWLFNTATNTWGLLTSSLSTPPVRAYHAMAATPSGVLLFGGGDGAADDTWLFNTATNSWDLLTGSPSTPPPRFAHAMSATSSGVILFGGAGSSGWPLDDTWLFGTLTPTISITSPNGGENWEIGSSHAISWTSINLSGNLAITLSHNGGSTYAETLAASVPVSAGSFNWTISEPASIICKVKITSIADSSVFDTSDGDFIISDLPSIAFTPTSFTFNCTQGQGNPSPQTLDVWNSGGGILNWTTSEGTGWLSLNPTSGSSTGEHDPVTVSVDASSLAAGTYTATITLAATGADNSPQQVLVSLTVQEPLPQIAFAPTSFTFNCTQGQGNPSPQTLDVWNSGGGILNWTASEGAGWLSLNPTSGSSTGEHDPVTVSVDASSLAAGTYTATITLAATGADNSPQQVLVSLTVQEIPTHTVTYSLQPNWNMISLPVTPASLDPQVVFGGLPSPWYLFEWNPLAATYVGKELIALRLGAGYWLKVPTAVSYPVTGLWNGAAQSGIDLGLNWNLIGVPYEGTIPWGAVRVSRYGGALVTLGQAVSSDWIQGMFFHWSGSTYEWFIAGGNFQSLFGYWVKAKVTGVRLVFLKP